MGQLPAVYALVVNYNGFTDTTACVASLFATDYERLRVIVLDNASSDGSLGRLASWAPGALNGCSVRTVTRRDFEGGSRISALRDRTLTLVDCEANLGFAGANNVGLRWLLAHDPGGYALLLNNDAVIAADALSAMTAMASAGPGVGAVGATVLRHDCADEVEMFAGATVNRATGMVRPAGSGAARQAPRPASVPLDFVSATCLLTRGAALEKVGLMDERFFLYSEDVDWGLRMQRAALQLRYCAAAEVVHKGGASVGHRSVVHDYYLVRAALMLVRKHAPQFLPVALVYWIWRGILPKLARGEWLRFRAAMRGYRDFLKGMSGQDVTAVQKSTTPGESRALRAD